VTGSIFSLYKISVPTKVRHDIYDINKKFQFFLNKFRPSHNVLLVFSVKKAVKRCDQRKFLSKKFTKIPQHQKYIILSLYKKWNFFDMFDMCQKFFWYFSVKFSWLFVMTSEFFCPKNLKKLFEVNNMLVYINIKMCDFW